jgi:hypothetical protein
VKTKNLGMLLLAVFFASLLPTMPARAPPPKKWTFMVYLDADVNLDSYAWLDIQEMEAVGSTADVNIVVLLDRWYKMCGFNGTEIYYVHQGWSERVWGDKTNEYELNMGDPATLSFFIGYAATNYPADKYALVLWDHGGNWRGICWDETTPNRDYLNMTELETALAASPVTIDVLGTDACLMASTEVTYTISLSSKVDVMVASEDYVPGYGYPYDMMLEELVANPDWDASDFGESMVDEYIASYARTGNSYATLAAIDLSYIPTLVDDIKALATELTANIEEYVDTITEAKSSADRYWFGAYHQGAYIDLRDFVEKLGSLAPDLQALTDQIISDWSNVVLSAKCCDGPHIRAGAGLTIYFPRNRNLYYTPDRYLLSVTEFAQYTGWLDFLKLYFEEYGPGSAGMGKKLLK